MPGMGRPLVASGERLRGHGAEQHIIVSRTDPDGILIPRVLSARQDWLSVIGDR